MKVKDLNKAIGFSLLIFFIIQLSTVTSYGFFDRGDRLLIISGFWLVITIPAFILTKHKRTVIFYIIWNAVMAGVAISAYYLYEEIEMYNIISITLYYLVILLLNYLLLYFLTNKQRANQLLLILSIVGIGVGCIIWFNGNLVRGSSIAFTSIITVCMNFSFKYYLHFDRKFDYMKLLKLSSMLMFGSIFLVVIIAISEGDAIEMLDGSWESEGRKRKKR